MTKLKFIILIIVLFAIVSLLTYLNYDKILTYFTNRQWEIADSVGKIEIESYIDTFGTSSNFYAVKTGSIEGYSDSVKKVFDITSSFKDTVIYTAGDYAIIAEKNSTNVMVICKDEIVWSNDISNGNILGVTINKNGYSAVIYSQTGYKSLVKVFSATGNELFTSYLASTYAIDVSISNDNKTLAIAEIDTEGISLASRIKLISIQSASEENVKKYDLNGNELISDIEYNSTNQLIILTDSNVKVLKDEKFSDVISFEEENVILANIQNPKKIVVAKVMEESLFNTKCEICLYTAEDNKETKSYEIDETPSSITVSDEIITIDTGNKVTFLNLSGNFVKKCDYKGQLKNVELFNGGKMAVLLFRDTAEFIKVGGI